MKTIAALILACAAVAYGADENTASFGPKSTYVMGGGCPNECSGHGYCRSDAKCFCFQGWLGYDCSKRECLSFPGWGVNDAVLHKAAECSYRGVCNRASGECECFEGYAGGACERTTCPNDCSGHGRCRYISELSEASAYTAWDANRIQTCVCDGGYMGSDCSLRNCPYGNDPQSICNEEEYQVQKVSLAFTTTDLTTNAAVTGAAADCDNTVGDFALQFTDSYGTVWQTGAIATPWASATSASTVSGRVQTALTSLPNFAVDSVGVTTGGTSDTNRVSGATSLDFYVTFSGDRNSGDQPLLSCPVDNGCPFAGCQPHHDQIRVVKSSVAAASQLSLVTPYVLQPASAGTQHTGHAFHVVVTVANTGTSFSYRTWSSPAADPGASTVDYKVPSTNYGTESVDVGRGIRFKFDAATPTDGDYKWSITVPSCSVSTHTHAGEHNERLECSGRGICDRGAGMCKCFDGYSGHACGTQMIVV